MKKIKKIIIKIEEMLKTEIQNCENAAMGYDEGWYNGRADALEDVLKILNENKGGI